MIGIGLFLVVCYAALFFSRYIGKWIGGVLNT